MQPPSGSRCCRGRRGGRWRPAGRGSSRRTRRRAADPAGASGRGPRGRSPGSRAGRARGRTRLGASRRRRSRAAPGGARRRQRLGRSTRAVSRRFTRATGSLERRVAVLVARAPRRTHGAGVGGRGRVVEPALRHRDRQLVRLARVAQVERPAAAPAGRRPPRPRARGLASASSARNAASTSAQRPTARAGAGTSARAWCSRSASSRPTALKTPGAGGTSTVPIPRRSGHLGCEQRPVPAEGHQRELACVAPAFDGHRADGTRHSRAAEQERAVRGVRAASSPRGAAT